MRNEFVDYLNTLHNYNGQNANVFGEKNVTSKYYDKLMVKTSLCDYIKEKMNDDERRIIILTGHAGDGKTSIMYQVLNDLGCRFDGSSRQFDIDLPTGRKCLCIKDYSEFSDVDKINVMNECKKNYDEGNYVFMVANTGPLINNFALTFPITDKDEVERKLINAIDKGNGETVDINGYNICVINIINVDNIDFAENFLKRIINYEEGWKKCEECGNKNKCHIIKNKELMKENSTTTFNFIRNHYIWMKEYGTRLTIRSMTQQLAFMFTGGIECGKGVEKLINDQKILYPNDYLYSNLFLGYKGIIEDEKAMKILSIKEAFKGKYDQKKLIIDEKLLIEENYRNIFKDDIEGLIKDEIKHYGSANGLNQMIRRMFFFFHKEETDEKNNDNIFSPIFNKYIKVKYKNDEDIDYVEGLVKKALNFIFTVSQSNMRPIPITLKRESGYLQNVLYVINSIENRDVRILIEEKKDLARNEKGVILIEVKNQKLKQEITLPLLDYFEELRNGIINTNIDAQLSRGIENIKAEIINIIEKNQNNDISMIVQGNNNIRKMYIDNRGGQSKIRQN